jgi:3-oxoacyl-[acyl-carrier protein] reductase
LTTSNWDSDDLGIEYGCNYLVPPLVRSQDSYQRYLNSDKTSRDRETVVQHYHPTLAMTTLQDQVVLITGSSRGLGLAIARAFHATGARIILNYVHPSSSRAATLAAQELAAIAIHGDVTSPTAVQSIFAQAEKHYNHPITVVVNNALAPFTFNGDARPKLDTITWPAFDAQFKGAVQAALNTTQAALPGFEKLGYGRIINIGSNLVQSPVVPYQDYTTAKGALLAFTRTCAAELGPKGITVNMVSGGLLRVTDASKQTPEEVFEMVKGVTPLRKVTSPEELAGAVLFFASPWARAVTGQNICVDGGLVMS